MPKIEVEEGTRLFVQDWGDGPPIVFVHGWPYSHRIFEPQMAQLALRGHRVVGLDLRGYGDSDKPWLGQDYDTWARDLRALFEELELREVLLVGHSMGGAIAARYLASQDHGRVKKLMLLAATAPSFSAHTPKTAIDRFISALGADQHGFVREFVQNGFATAISTEKLAFYSGLGSKASLRAITCGMEELRERDLSAELRRLELPTRICHGAHDVVMPFAAAEEQARLIRGATLVRFERSGHGLFHDEADKLTHEIAKFAEAPLADQMLPSGGLGADTGGL